MYILKLKKFFIAEKYYPSPEPSSPSTNIKTEIWELPKCNTETQSEEMLLKMASADFLSSLLPKLQFIRNIIFANCNKSAIKWGMPINIYIHYIYMDKDW